MQFFFEKSSCRICIFKKKPYLCIAIEKQTYSTRELRSSQERMGKYQSGQMGQTVNLLSFDFGGSNPSLPTKHCGSSSVDRALAFQAEGRGFEPRLPLYRRDDSFISFFIPPYGPFYSFRRTPEKTSQRFQKRPRSFSK